MEFKNYSYLILLVTSVALPLIFSFVQKIRFYSKLKYLFPAMLFSVAIFILWDLRFEERAIWRFNSEYVLGFNILNLPVEEWIYFFVASYLFVFIYEFVKFRFSTFEKPNLFLAISLGILVLSGIIAYSTRLKLYPFFTFFLLAVYLGYTIFRNRFKKHYTKFYLAFFVSLVPFTIINGILTALPIIEYNPDHYFGVRLYSIPVENYAYLFLFFLINITIYEYLKERRIY